MKKEIEFEFSKKGVIGAILLVVWLWYWFGGGLKNQATSNLNDIKQQVASDEVKQYEIAKRDGSKMNACVHAGLAAEGYLQAQDESGYQQWKAIENADCADAGVPQQ